MSHWKELLARRRLRKELDEEIAAHLEIESQRRIDDGESPEEARTNALREIRSVDFVKESIRPRQ